MIGLALTLTVALAKVLFQSRLELLVENLALRQQLAVFKQKRSRPRMGPGDRMFWVFLRTVCVALPRVVGLQHRYAWREAA